MKFSMDDGNGVIQDFELKDGPKKGDVIVNMSLREAVNSVLDDNKRQRNFGRQTLGKGTQTSMYKLGEISMLQAHILMQQGIFQDDNALRKWFNDYDNYLWRVVDKSGARRAVQGLQDSGRQPEQHLWNQNSERGLVLRDGDDVRKHQSTPGTERQAGV